MKRHKDGGTLSLFAVSDSPVAASEPGPLIAAPDGSTQTDLGTVRQYRAGDVVRVEASRVPATCPVVQPRVGTLDVRLASSHEICGGRLPGWRLVRAVSVDGKHSEPFVIASECPVVLIMSRYQPRGGPAGVEFDPLR